MIRYRGMLPDAEPTNNFTHVFSSFAYYFAFSSTALPFISAIIIMNDHFGSASMRVLLTRAIFSV